MQKETIILSELPVHTKKEVIKKLFIEVFEGRKDGFTINSDLYQPETGYIIGIYSDNEILRKFQVKMYTDLNKFENQIIELIDLYFYNDIKFYLGTWVHNNEVYIDLSIRTEDKQTAIDSAKIFSQLAIYDLSKKETIYL